MTGGRESGKDSEQLLAEALRARAGGTPALGKRGSAGGPVRGADGRTVAERPALTLVQLILASLIAGLVVGILVAVLTLI